NRVNKLDLLAIMFLGIVGVFINQWSFFVGLQTADPTTSALILATAPILTGFLAAIFLKEKLTIRMLVGSVVAIIGIYFVVTKGSLSSFHINKGLIWIVLTMATFAIMIILTRLLSKRTDPLTITLYSNLVGFIVQIPLAFVLDSPVRISTNVSDCALLTRTAGRVHRIATLIVHSNINHVHASKASILSHLEPFLPMITEFILLHKP